MRRFQCALVAAVAVFGFASVASAADMAIKAPALAPAPAYSWTGFYVGGQLGWDYQNARTDLTPLPGPFFGGLFQPAFAIGMIPATTSQNGGGLLGGITAGYNIQTSWVVWGVEGDFNWIAKQHTSVVTGIPFGGTTLQTTVATQTDWLSTVRGRIGALVLPDTLLFATGGLAIGRVAGSSSINAIVGGPCPSGNAFCSMGSATSTRTGWTVGGGLEHLLMAHWTAKIEYLYYDLGSFNYALTEQAAFTGLVGTPNVNAHTSVTGSIVRVGANYKF
jgi:outer membrane immunogenic protein